MEAARLKLVDEDYRNHLQAWLNFAVQATNKKGKPRFKKFKQFFDYDAKIEEAKTGSGKKGSMLSGLRKFLKKGE